VWYRSRCSRYNVWCCTWMSRVNFLLASLISLSVFAPVTTIWTRDAAWGGVNMAGGVSGEMGVECVEVAVGGRGEKCVDGGRIAQILAWLVMARRSRLDAAGSAYSHGSRGKTRRIRLDAHKSPNARTSTAPSYSRQYGSMNTPDAQDSRTTPHA